ncbi:phosphoribosylformylglycinamidine cyclo-ligase [Helicobacter cappadocius]|uniref:Phosphoribosylformylglycinamidine cyclo-ligase n=1 Tax=Helicobacter cappadocius TaxID=3063998 RepID=A0AA90PUJ6_9HELI|nr:MULTISPECIES: phosphoribosylformylglycinamidine cyclo-ligase [unclassified Helicobacter]MDO7252857.1 phosphoribosylformylglycinamidine cyclo-ligase [Helicobacter sp. faydin-H75]MDP2538900.1 phosphoribosylformylglycinamidine cyclo-ligase [Helicobacter sp. faydin-H76]
MQSISYKDSGVDIDEGNAFVEGIKPYVKATFDKNVIGGIGSFAGAYELPGGFKEPVILAATDGVGTKLRLAIDSDRLEGVGIDLVAMCVNDLICNFATPMFFLDYYASAKLDKYRAIRVVQGIAKGCEIAQCSLIGGETAEMPGMYQHKDFDLAGFAVGIAEKSDLQRQSNIKQGDVLIALQSSGIHSNGYSLVRKLLFEELKMKFEDQICGKTLIETLLTPTRIYVDDYKKIKNHINALAHITGGGIVENLPRVLPKDLRAQIDTKLIKTLPIFDILKLNLDEDEVYRVFNMGVGMIIVAPRTNLDYILKNTDGYEIGEIITAPCGVDLI